MEIEILNNTKSHRLILVDKLTNQAITSFSKKEAPEFYEYLFEYHNDEIKDYRPIKL